MTFSVIDKKTGKEANSYEIAKKEKWAKGLLYIRMDGFALLEDGSLLLLDSCGNYVYCEQERFEVVEAEETPDTWIIGREDGRLTYTHDTENCLTTVNVHFPYCPYCGKKMKL